MQRFENLGVIKNQLEFDPQLLATFETSIAAMKKNLAWDKDSLVKLFFKMLPDFDHKETGKYLDGKM